MMTYAILLLSCLAILTYYWQLGGRRFTAYPQDFDLTPDLEFEQRLEREQRGRVLATLIFAIIIIFVLFWATYGA